MDIAIVGAKRSPIGKLMGGLSALSAAELGAQVIEATLDQAHLSPDQVDEVVLGQVLTAATGQGPARQAARQAGIRDTATALSINQLCGSGLRAVALAAQQITTSQADILLAGGQESMSQAPHAQVLRGGQKFGNLELVDTLAHDGLTDAFYGTSMGITAENIADRWHISRQAQDAFALESQSRTAAALTQGRFNEELTPIRIATRKEVTRVEADEFPRPQTSAQSLASLSPAFKQGGTVTAGNASGLNDGAAVLALMAAKQVGDREVLARLVSFATAGVAPDIMGTGPIPASRLAIKRAGWTLDQLNLVECNEAFAAQSLCVIQELGLDPAKVNVNGGAIALGHPIGASGARVLVTLIHGLRARGGGRGLATLCIGGGMGVAMCIQV